MADYRFARRPGWIAGHLLAVGLLVLFVSLGFWQLQRLDERRATNALVIARSLLQPEPVGDLVDPGDDDGADDIRFRAVVAEGTYSPVAEVGVRSTQGGAPGMRIFTALDLGNGESVAVLRGFAGQGSGGEVADTTAPTGPVEVEGIAFPRDRLELVTRQALDDLADGVPGLLPVIVQADEVDVDTLTPVPAPDLSEGPHLSYAVQWFLFAAVGVVGYPLLLRRRAREKPAAERGD